MNKLFFPLIITALIPIKFLDAATATGVMTVSATVQASCSVTAEPFNFGTIAISESPLASGTSTISVTCTNGTSYTVGLDGGAHQDVTDRLMSSGINTLNYQLYSDSGKTSIWGNTVGTRVQGTGSGLAQALTVYGAVPVQTIPAPGTYVDLINITVDY